MEQIELDPNNIAISLERLFRHLFATPLESGDASLQVESSDKQQGFGRSVSIIPHKLGRAPIIAFCENGGEIIYLTVGQNTSLEVPLTGGRYTNLEGAKELIALVKAVAEGSFEEEIWMKDTNIVKSIGRFFIDNGPPLVIQELEVLTNPFASLERKTQRYLSYFSHDA